MERLLQTGVVSNSDRLKVELKTESFLPPTALLGKSSHRIPSASDGHQIKKGKKAITVSVSKFKLFIILKTML